MEHFTNEDILIRYPSCLRENIQELWMHGQVGEYRNPLNFTENTIQTF